MSELMNTQDAERDFRWQLLTTVSALALLAAVYGSSEAKAADEDADRPTVWIELGGQLEHVSGQGDLFTPGFLAANPNSPVLQPVTPVQAQNPPTVQLWRGRQDFISAGRFGLGLLGRRPLWPVEQFQACRSSNESECSISYK